jgi:glycerol-3-phosphate dehydrogenase
VRLIGRYGASAAKLITEAFQEELQPIDNDNFESPLWAELRWAARSEAVVHLDDLLLRRIRLGLILKDGAIRQMDRIRKIVQPELGWEDDRWDRELQNYIRLWSATYKLTTE